MGDTPGHCKDVNLGVVERLECLRTTGMTNSRCHFSSSWRVVGSQLPSIAEVWERCRCFVMGRGQAFLISLSDSYGKLLVNISFIKLHYPICQLFFNSLKKR